MSEWYDEIGTEFSQKAVALAAETGLPIADATMQLARERPDLLALHDLWTADDKSKLPRWLQHRHYDLFGDPDREAGGESQEEKETPLALFNAEVAQRAARFAAGGLSELDAISKAQDECMSEVPEPLRAPLMAQIG